MYYGRGGKDGMGLEEGFEWMEYEGVRGEIERAYDLNGENRGELEKGIRNVEWKEGVGYEIGNYELI